MAAAFDLAGIRELLVARTSRGKEDRVYIGGGLLTLIVVILLLVWLL